jgi:hypothetical protein
MALDLSVAQAVVVAGPVGPTVAAKSDDFAPAWEDAALTAAVRFGRRPPGVACPAAVFAVPVGKTHVAVVQVADRSGSDAADPPLAFRFLVLGRKVYEALGDPFAIADRFPPDWSATGTLQTLAWPPEPLPARTVDVVQGVLKGGDGPLLLGAAQALTDGGRLMLVSKEPAGDVLRGLWQLLPDRTRAELWPATFAFSPDLGFHAVVLPDAPEPWPTGYLTADHARDYPEGRYELALQIAVEAGNQAELDRLFARRSSADTLRLALYLLGAAVLLTVIMKLF